MTRVLAFLAFAALACGQTTQIPAPGAPLASPTFTGTVTSGTGGFVGAASGSTAQLSLTNPTTSSRYVWQSQNANAAKGPFGAVIDTTLFNSTYDEALATGYNCAPGGGRVLGTEPAFCHKTEQDYEATPGNHFLEDYYQWVSADGTQSRRPLFWQIDRSNGNLTLFELRSSGMSLTDWATAAQWGSLSAGGLTITGITGQSTDTVLSVAALNGKATQLSLASPTTSPGKGIAITWDPSGFWAMTATGQSAFEFGSSWIALNPVSLYPVCLGLTACTEPLTVSNTNGTVIHGISSSTNATQIQLTNTSTGGTDWYIGSNGSSHGAGGAVGDLIFYQGGLQLVLQKTTGNAIFTGTIKGAGYKSSDGSAGVTGATCTAWKNGLCTTL